MTIDPKKTKVSIGMAVVVALVVGGWAWSLSAHITSNTVRLEVVIQATEAIPQMEKDIAVIKQAVGVGQVTRK